jgi:hypothetical protein
VSHVVIPDECDDLKGQRAVLLSNSAQVRIEIRDWSEARQLAERALEDDPKNFKSTYRLAKAHVGLRQFPTAAPLIDTAIGELSRRKDSEKDPICLEFWKLAEEVSKALPNFEWSQAKPQAKADDNYEKRIAGVWSYGNNDAGQFQIRLEPWGALDFIEEQIKIPLLRTGLLRWQGEFEMVSGMILRISYEPGSDVIVTNWDVPDDMPEEQRWKGPTRFTAKRVSGQATDKQGVDAMMEEEGAPSSEHEAAANIEPPAPVDEAAVEAQRKQEEALDAVKKAPNQIWFVGHSELLGRYELMDAKIENFRPVYRREASGSSSELFLWYRGGNWGVTAQLHSSTHAAPFLARCADVSGRAKHPVEIRTQRWYVRKGRGQEELDSAVSVQSSSDSLTAGSMHSAVVMIDSAGSNHPAEELPMVVDLSGRIGTYSELNGRYALRQGSAWCSRPVYWHTTREGHEDALAMFFDHGYWVIAKEVRSVPYSLARHRGASFGAVQQDSEGIADAHPAVASTAPWEFLSDGSSSVVLVNTETRKYRPDRAVSVRAVSSSSATAAEASPCESASDQSAPTSAKAPSLDTSPLVPNQAATQNVAPVACNRTPLLTGGYGQDVDGKVASVPIVQPAWIVSASAELVGAEVRAVLVIGHGVAVDMQQLNLDIALESLKVELPGHAAFELQLPSTVDTESNPVARWSEKTRTLKVRLVAQGARVAAGGC